MSFNIIQDRFYVASEPKVKILDIGVYHIKYDINNGECYFEFISDSFKMPEKLYDVSKNFNDRVIKSYKSIKGNLGIMLNGVQGCGKSVSSKLISNELKLPVFIIQEGPPMSALTKLLNALEQEFILFIDEYEKIYGNSDSLLMILDGATSPKNKFLLIATVNEMCVSQYLIGRPSRIRYIKEFTFLSKNVIEEIVNDKLVHKELYDRTVKVISEQCNELTVDSCIAFIEEINIYNEDPLKLLKDFNITSNLNAELLETVIKNNNRQTSKKSANIGFRKASKVEYSNEEVDIDEKAPAYYKTTINKNI